MSDEAVASSADLPTLPGALVDVAWLREHLGEPDLVVLDATVLRDDGSNSAEFVDGAESWARGHIPGSAYADLAGELADPEAGFSYAYPGRQRMIAGLAALGVTPRSRVVVYDNDARMWSTRLWWTMRTAGFTRAAVLDGGWPAWVAAGAPVETGQRERRPAAAQPLDLSAWPAPATSNLVDRTRVSEAVAGRRPEVRLVCALGESAFRGETTAGYARDGHIPGSSNLPAKDRLLAADGTFVTKPELERALADLPEAPELVAYCGGGVSATLLAFAMHLIGRERVRVYDGSLEEWSADPDLPMVGPVSRGATKPCSEEDGMSR